MTQTDTMDSLAAEWLIPYWKTLEFWAKYSMWGTIVAASLWSSNGSGLDPLLRTLAIAICVVSPPCSAVAVARHHERIRLALAHAGDDGSSRRALAECVKAVSGVRWESFVVLANLWLLSMLH